MVCKIAKVSPSGYYNYLKHTTASEEKEYKDYLLIKGVFNTKTGARTIKMELEGTDVVMNLKKIRRIMKKYGLVCSIRRIHKARVSLQRNKEDMFVTNILKRRFKQYIPYTVLSTDITYLRHSGSFSFLSTVKDLASGEILVYELSQYMNLELVLNTVDKLEAYYRARGLRLDNVLLHSDQGFQYTNHEYHKKLKRLRIMQSMSRRGNSVDNAPIESFFGHLKDEIDIKELHFFQLKESVDAYMLEYNYKRKQWGRQKMTPVFYRNHLLELRSISVRV